MTTQSEPTGTKLTDVVIVVGHALNKALVQGVTASGQAWVNRNTYKPEYAKVVIDVEYVEEYENLIKADGLKVSRI